MAKQRGRPRNSDGPTKGLCIKIDEKLFNELKEIAKDGTPMSTIARKALEKWREEKQKEMSLLKKLFAKGA